MSTWYSIRKRTAAAIAALGAVAGAAAAPVSEAEILIYGDIGESWWSESVSAAAFVREINALDVATLTVRINSIGGSVPDGIAIFNAIKRHKAHVTTIADGMALSIASLILCAGDTVQMADNSTLMVHAPWTIAAGNSTELRDAADLLDTWASAMANSYAAKTGEAKDKALARLTDGKDHWYTAEEAKDAGFVDEVVSSAPVAAMAGADLSRYRDVPAAVLARVKPAPQKQPSQPAASNAPGNPNSNPTEPSMPQPIDTTNAAALEAARVEARAEGARAEAQRCNDIRAAFQPFASHEGLSDEMTACLADHTVTAAVANHRILAALAKGATPANASHGIRTVEDERDKRVSAGTQALLARAASTAADGKRVIAESSNPFRGHSLVDLARAALVRAGVKTDGMDRMQIVGAAFTHSTSDFPVLLENVMHKALLAGYALQAFTWNRFCATGSVSDFRAHNRYRVGSLGNLELVAEGAEYKYKQIPDGEKASISAQTKGMIVSITRQMVINDDMQALVGIPTAQGRSAARTVEADVFAALTSNGGLGPVLADNKTLFHADHANIGTGAALSVDSIDADNQLMGAQKDVSGNDYLDLMPSILLVPVGLRGRAIELNQQEYNDESNKQQRRPNIVRGLYSDVVSSPRLSGTRRYSFADVGSAPVLEVAFLDGNQTPFLDQEQGFDVDGTAYKVRLDYGIAGIDFRGAVTNAGA